MFTPGPSMMSLPRARASWPMASPSAIAKVGIPRRGETDARRHGGGKIIRAPGRIPGVRPDVFAHAMRPIVQPAARDGQPRNRGGGEFGIRVNQRNLFRQRQPRQQIVHACFDGLTGIEIPRRVPAPRTETIDQASAKLIAPPHKR